MFQEFDFDGRSVVKTEVARNKSASYGRRKHIAEIATNLYRSEKTDSVFSAVWPGSLLAA